MEELTSFSQETKSIHVAVVADLSQLLKFGWKEGRTDPVHVASVDLDADVAVVHLEEVERTLSGADVALP